MPPVVAPTLTSVKALVLFDVGNQFATKRQLSDLSVQQMRCLHCNLGPERDAHAIAPEA